MDTTMFWLVEYMPRIENYIETISFDIGLVANVFPCTYSFLNLRSVILTYANHYTVELNVRNYPALAAVCSCLNILRLFKFYSKNSKRVKVTDNSHNDDSDTTDIEYESEEDYNDYDDTHDDHMLSYLRDGFEKINKYDQVCFININIYLFFEYQQILGGHNCQYITVSGNYAYHNGTMYNKGISIFLCVGIQFEVFEN